MQPGDRQDVGQHHRQEQDERDQEEHLAGQAQDGGLKRLTRRLEVVGTHHLEAHDGEQGGHHLQGKDAEGLQVSPDAKHVDDRHRNDVDQRKEEGHDAGGKDDRIQERCAHALPQPRTVVVPDERLGAHGHAHAGHEGKRVDAASHTDGGESAGRADGVERTVTHQRLVEDDVDESVLNWKPMGQDPDMADSSVQSRLDSTLGGKAIVVPPELEEKMKNNPELAQKVMDKVDNFIKNHPTRPGRVLSYLIALDENGDIAHFRVTGGGGHISGPSEAELRQFEEEQEAKREKKAQQEKENREYNLKVAEERKRLQEEVYNRQSAEAILQEQMVSNSKITEIMAAYEAGTFVDGGII